MSANQGYAVERRALEARLALLEGREDAIAVHLRGEDGRRAADSGDLAAITQGDEVLEGLDRAALTEITEIRAALDRMDGARYGMCEDCGQEIVRERLVVVPHARRCADCAASAGG